MPRSPRRRCSEEHNRPGLKDLAFTRRIKDLAKTDINKALKDIMAGRISIKTKKLRGIAGSGGDGPPIGAFARPGPDDSQFRNRHGVTFGTN